MLQTLNQDIRYALRTLRQSPGFTLVAILTLALGIGANTTIFSVINAVLLRPLPYSNPDRLVMMAEHWPAFPILSVSYQNYKDFRDQSSSYETVAAIQPINYTLTGSNEPERVDGMMISASLLPMLGIQPIVGRTILPDDDRVGVHGLDVPDRVEERLPLRDARLRGAHVHHVGTEALAGELERRARPRGRLEEQVDDRAPAQRGALHLRPWRPHPREDPLRCVEEGGDVLRGELLDPEQVAMGPHASQRAKA